MSIEDIPFNLLLSFSFPHFLFSFSSPLFLFFFSSSLIFFSTSLFLCFSGLIDISRSIARSTPYLLSENRQILDEEDFSLNEPKGSPSVGSMVASRRESETYLHARNLYVTQRIIHLKLKLFLKWRRWSKSSQKKKKIIFKCDGVKQLKVISFLRISCRLRKCFHKIKR